MNKVYRTLLIFSLIISSSFHCFLYLAHAASFQVTKIGGLDLGGKTYSEWWYTEIYPTFYGTGVANTEVSITIDGQTYKTTTDAQGNWSYGSVLEKGDYNMSFTQGQGIVAFKLHLGQTMQENIESSSEQSTQSAIPATGFNQLVAVGMGAGVMLLSTYFYILGDPRRKSVFEAKILKED